MTNRVTAEWKRSGLRRMRLAPGGQTVCAPGDVRLYMGCGWRCVGLLTVGVLALYVLRSMCVSCMRGVH